MSDYARFKEINKLLASGHPELAREELRGLQAHVIALHDEVSRLHARIGNFEELLSIPRAVTQENGLVWINTKNGRQGPFCPHSTPPHQDAAKRASSPSRRKKRTEKISSDSTNPRRQTLSSEKSDPGDSFF